MSRLTKNSAEEISHLRSKSRFYVAGWTANNMCENPQDLPASCIGNTDAENQYEDYLSGYGDSYANNESVATRYKDNLAFISKMNEATNGAFV
jgi:hypothetical protein